ncbi:MAG: DASH family cryptochrome [Bacteroidia bacterium]|nr:DASH family cryptochrome [Bacteroidia bacterium]MBT8276471.1 DASH family cryptochrome [Bacteroidia bacterium]NNF32020.1 DASH family cryptochrome [Flavobacteriaceae bacterium]NNK53460.1 DASH family cryptochrome [Flavobacteriaceae bacterium]NNM09809.1 DASH family cryptochrome [Flavobacteriaceae bacterium]
MKNSLVWFRNDLRISDNSVLTGVCADSDKVIAVYCFDPRQYATGDFGFVKTGKYRAKFLIETVTDLKIQLSRLNIPLFISLSRPEDYIPGLIEAHDIKRIHFQEEWTRDEKNVEDQLRRAIPETVEIFRQFDQFLFHPKDIPFENLSQIPEVFTAFRKKLEKYAEVRRVIGTPKALPKENLIENRSELPSLTDLGHDDFSSDSRSAFPFQGGETAGLKRIDDYIWESENISKYKETRNGLVGKDYSSKFSAWLANGSLSARMIYWAVRKFEKERIKNSSTYWMIFELIWRDFFKYVSLKHGDSIFHLGGILNKDYHWKNDRAILQNWIHGKTEYDFVNANMKELAATGWMSNRGRQNVASYWAKEKEQDWRVGASYFESMLVDYDVHSNWGNWMYNAGVGNDPRDRKFNIQRQAEMYDKEGSFRKLWNR